MVGVEAGCRIASVDKPASRRKARRMNHTGTAFQDAARVLLGDSLALLSAAQRLEAHAREPATAGDLPISLALVEEALHTLARCCEEAADMLIPSGDPREPVSVRFARSAAGWPGVTESAGPSRERQARILVALHDAGGALRAAGERCGNTGELLASTFSDLGGERRRTYGVRGYLTA